MYFLANLVSAQRYKEMISAVALWLYSMFISRDVQEQIPEKSLHPNKGISVAAESIRADSTCLAFEELADTWNSRSAKILQTPGNCSLAGSCISALQGELQTAISNIEQQFEKGSKHKYLKSHTSMI